MRRNYWVVVANVVVLAMVAGCRDSIVEPTMAPSGAPVSMVRAPAGMPALSVSGGGAVASTADFTVTRNGGVFAVGKNVVVFPANSICDPATSGYGPGTWDKPCKATNSAIRFHAVVSVTASGGTSVEFSPNVRFVPSTDPRSQVWLFMQAPTAIGATGDLSRFNILYFATKGGALVDEAASDPMLRTYVDTHTGISARVVKHFTGYGVGSGRSCEPTVDNPCTDTDTSINP